MRKGIHRSHLMNPEVKKNAEHELYTALQSSFAEEIEALCNMPILIMDSYEAQDNTETTMTSIYDKTEMQSLAFFLGKDISSRNDTSACLAELWEDVMRIASFNDTMKLRLHSLLFTEQDKEDELGVMEVKILLLTLARIIRQYKEK